MAHRLAEIARLLGGELRGSDAAVRGVAALDEAQPDELSLCADRRQRAALRATRAGGVLLAGRLVELVPEAPCPCVLVSEPRRALAVVLAELHPATEPAPGVQAGALVAAEAAVDPTARVEPGARVDPGAHVGPGCWIGPQALVAAGASLAAGCHIGAGAVVLGCCRLGERVRIGPGSVLGGAGFGLVESDGRWQRMPQVGRVEIEAEVEIGANCTVDRATLGATRIGRGSKIDNLVQVGHNVTIGRRVRIAAQSGLSGSVTIEDDAVLGGQVGVADHRTIGAGAQVGAKSGVGSNVPAGARVVGYPAVAVQRWLDNAFGLPRLRRALRRLEARLK